MQGVILASRDRFDRNAEANFGGNVVSPDGYLLALWLHECRWAGTGALAPGTWMAVRQFMCIPHSCAGCAACAVASHAVSPLAGGGGEGGHVSSKPDTLNPTITSL